jgi:hypothetical protein
MTPEVSLIVQLPSNGPAARLLRADPPVSIANGHAVVEHFPVDADGRLESPEAGEVILSVLSPEALARESEQVRDVIRHAETGDEPPVIIVEAAEELRDDEIAVVLNAAADAHRVVILRVMADA